MYLSCPGARLHGNGTNTYSITVVNTVAERMVMAFADRNAGPKDLDMHVLRACVNLEVVHAAGDDLRARQVATRRPRVHAAQGRLKQPARASELARKSKTPS